MDHKKKYLYQKVNKVEFLSNVRLRLKNDVFPYLELVKKIHKETGTGVGFWALARMIFPPIEAVANAIYRKENKTKILKELDIEYPFLAWDMFRHNLMHNDEMISASYRNKKVEWSVTIGGGHSAKDRVLKIDVSKLLHDFDNFLEKQIKDPSNLNKHVWIKKSYKLKRRGRLDLRNEIRAFGNSE